MKFFLSLAKSLTYLVLPVCIFFFIPMDLLDYESIVGIEAIELPEKLWSEKDPACLPPEFEGMEEAYDGPLPWAYDDRFSETLRKYNSPRLMAAYKATLHEPLPGEAENIELAAKKIAGVVVQPQKIFSQNATIGPYTKDKGYKFGPTYAGSSLVTTVGGGVCKIASLLYNLATLCDLEIIQRHPHSMTVPYVPPVRMLPFFMG